MKKTIYYFLFYVCFCSNTVNAQVNVQDSLALIDLYNSTDGPHWYAQTNWLTSSSVSTWYGITVTNNRVTEIVLDAGLKGNIPSSIGNLGNLTVLKLHGNSLSGSIPSSIGNLVKLQYLALSSNLLTGSIPSTIGNLVNLQTLYLFVNELSGNIPASIGNLTNLQTFESEYNQLSGSIPASIGNLVNLQDLNLSENQLAGNIPSSIGNLVNMVHLQLEGNLLTGKIPFSIGNLVNINQLELQVNQLNGTIPSSIGNLTHLIILSLAFNRLSGPIPSSIGDLVAVKAISLSYNHFTFDGMELIPQNLPNEDYDHQKNIPIHQNGNTLSVSAGGTLSNNTYKLLKWEGTTPVLVATNKGDSVFHPAVSGRYRVKILNSVATKLKLYSKSIDYIAPNNAVAALGENDLQQNDKTNLFRVYPNPARNILFVETKGNASFSLLDQSGKIYLTATINGKGSIDIFNMAAGLYYLKNNSTGKVQKVVIAR